MNIWWIFAILSVLINFFFVWYIRELLVRFSYIGENVDKMYADLSGYEEHLASVYDLPVFYGDSTLSGLLKHTSDMKEIVGSYKEIFSLEEERLLEEAEESEDA